MFTQSSEVNLILVAFFTLIFLNFFIAFLMIWIKEADNNIKARNEVKNWAKVFAISTFSLLTVFILLTLIL